MVHTLQTLSIISFAVAGVCLVVSVFFWFFFKIPTVIGDLSGRTARKSIAKMRAANEKNGTKTYKTSKTNAERGKLTDTMPNMSKSKNKKEVDNNSKPETGLLAENRADGPESEVTGMLDKGTEILDYDATGLLIDENATVSLDTPAQKSTARIDGIKLEIIEDVMMIHTDEVIEC